MIEEESNKNLEKLIKTIQNINEKFTREVEKVTNRNPENKNFINYRNRSDRCDATSEAQDGVFRDTLKTTRERKTDLKATGWHKGD